MARKKFYQHDLQNIPVLGFVPEKSASAPSNPVDGKQWIDTSTSPNPFKVYQGSAWLEVCLLDSGGKVLFSELPTGTGAAQVAVGNHGHSLTDANITGILPIAQIPTGTTGTTVALGNHAHDAADVTSGVFAIGRIPTGTSGTTAALGNHSHTLASASITDVTVTSPATGQVLRWNGTVWANAALAISDITNLTTTLAGKVDTTRTVSAGTGLTGGGDLSANRSLAVDFSADGTSTAGKVVQANDSRLSNSRTPSGSAGGDLTGSYPNPTVANLAITDGKVAAANKDGAAGTPSMRTLGTGATQALAGNTRLDQIAAPTSAVSLNSQRITNVATPSVGTDAANKDYVDAARSGITWKDPVRVVTTTNINLASPGASLDGVAMASGDRFLAAGQTTGSQNGIYVWNGAAVAATRASDADTSAEVPAGTQTFVNEGTNADSQWTLTTNGPITLNTTSLTFSKTGGSGGTITAGDGLVQNAQAFDVNPDGSTLEVVSDQVRVKDLGITNAKIANSTINLTQKVTGVLPVANGGTGGSTAAAARTSLGAVGKAATTLGALTAGTEATFAHNLNSTDIVVSFKEVSTNRAVDLDWRTVDANTIGVTSEIAVAASAIRLIVVG